MSPMMACSCGSLFEEGDAYCANCGKARPLTAPPQAPPRPDDSIPEPPPTVSQPLFPRAGIPDEQAHGDGWRLPRQHHEQETPTAHSPESGSPSPFDADAVYLQKTLRHEPMEIGLDDSVSLSTLGFLLVRAFFAWGIVSIVLSILSVFGGWTLLFLALLASTVVFWVVLLASKVTEPIGEWRTLLADRAGQSESYYRMITAVLERRELPITPQLRRIELNTKGRPVKNMILLSESEYQIYVTVFPYGTSLYIGWQMWRRRSGAQLIKRAIVDQVTAANLVTAMLRTDRARAVREAVHLACREAVYATPDERLQERARRLPLPQVGQESALLSPQPASPVLLPASAGFPESMR